MLPLKRLVAISEMALRHLEPYLVSTSSLTCSRPPETTHDVLRTSFDRMTSHFPHDARHGSVGHVELYSGLWTVIDVDSSVRSSEGRIQ